jgi:uncharacterized cysteine cluster protein YcgN (CxxCxxCC family)
MTQLPVLNQADKEALCRRCGVSCHLPLEVGNDKYVVEEIHCRFMAREGDGRYGCTVYEKRFEVAPWCHTAEDAAATGNLSSDCLYAAHIPGYKGKTWASPTVREKLIPIVRKKLIAEGLPLSANPDSALKVLTSGGEAWSYAEESDRFVFHRKS